MTIDPNQIRQFAGQPPPQARVDDTYSASRRADADAVRRLQVVSYMEISADASGFSCGDCVHGSPAPRAFCTKPDVNSPVSPKRGCCNAFSPLTSRQVFP
jgi:hypothetical protein